MSTADDTPNPDDPFEPSDDPEHLDDLSRELDDLVDFANLEREMTEAANTTPSGPYAGQSAGERKRMEPPVGRVASVVPGPVSYTHLALRSARSTSSCSDEYWNGSALRITPW